VFRTSDGTQLSNYRELIYAPVFTLSPDGRMLARQTSSSSVGISDISTGSLLCSTPRGRFHNAVRVELGSLWLWMKSESFTHLIEWDKGKLTATFPYPGKGIEPSKEKKLAPLGLGVAAHATALKQLLPHLGHDHRRFTAAAVSALVAVVDRFGQVALLNREGELVCMFFAFRHNLAAWMPDGTCSGPRALLGRSPTPGAEEKIGAALRDAGRHTERTGAS
jgi:hypothetical protein